MTVVNEVDLITVIQIKYNSNILLIFSHDYIMHNDENVSFKKLHLKINKRDKYVENYLCLYLCLTLTDFPYPSRLPPFFHTYPSAHISNIQYMRASTHARAHTHTHEHARTHTHTHARMRTRTHTRTHARAHTHTYPHTLKQTDVEPRSNSILVSR